MPCWFYISFREKKFLPSTSVVSDAQIGPEISSFFFGGVTASALPPVKQPRGRSMRPVN